MKGWGAVDKIHVHDPVLYAPPLLPSMKGILNDRYLLMGLALSSILILSTTMIPDDDRSDGWISGSVHDVRESAKGFVFDLHTTDDRMIRCFCNEKPVSEVCMVKGRFSDDGGMLFVDRMEVITLN